LAGGVGLDDAAVAGGTEHGEYAGLAEGGGGEKEEVRKAIAVQMQELRGDLRLKRETLRRVALVLEERNRPEGMA
jgi:hypothetical protein